MRHKQPMAAMAVICLAVLGVAACGSSSASSTTSASNASSSPSSTSSSSSGSPAAAVAYANQQLSQYEKPFNTYQAPGPPIKGGKAAVTGKTLWYIPITAVPPFFAVTRLQVTEAAGKLGMAVQTCDAKVDPTKASACINEAVANKAGAIITDAVPVGFAQDAFTNAVNAHIPVVDGYVIPPGPTNGNFAKYFTAVSGFETQAEQLTADVMIADSGGKGNFLMTIDSDISSSIAASEAGINEVKQHCPSCTVASYSVKANYNPNLASTVSSQILSHPNAQYFYAPYEDPSGTIYAQALRTAGRSMKLMMCCGDTAGLARVAAGTQLGDILVDPSNHAWELVDAGLRMMTGTAHGTYVGFNRIFVKSNVPKNLTLAAWESGAWWSNGEFKQVYEKLWGVG